MALEEALSKYQPKMYLESPPESLHPGDVVRLSATDLASIVKYDGILPLFRQFEGDSSYKRPLWCLLNKTCDMHFDQAVERNFKSNLLIAPIIGLRAFIRKGHLGNIVVTADTPQSPHIFVRDQFTLFMAYKVRSEAAKPESMSDGDWARHINETMVNPAVRGLEELLTAISEDDPNEIILSLIDAYTGNEATQANLEELRNSKSFEKALNKYRKKVEEAKVDPSVLVLKTDGADAIAALTINQRDSQGYFFFEPDIRLSEIDDDIAFVIKLDDIISVKIRPDFLEAGQIQSFLKERRMVSLTPNFADRLLNIMGTYFAKIGTPDVHSREVLAVYKAVYPDAFFLSKDEYSTARAAKI